MANADRCVCCGEIIPEGMHVCPRCKRRVNHSKKRYSVYDSKTDMPLIIYASAKECANAMGITIGSFYRYVVHTRRGTRNMQKWAVYEDEMEGAEDGIH